MSWVAWPGAQRLKEMDINIIEDATGAGKDFSGIKAEDVVILPAFGATVQEMQLLNERGVQIVDTTCPWVAKVRASSETHGAQQFVGHANQSSLSCRVPVWCVARHACCCKSGCMQAPQGATDIA